MLKNVRADSISTYAVMAVHRSCKRESRNTSASQCYALSNLMSNKAVTANHRCSWRRLLERSLKQKLRRQTTIRHVLHKVIVTCGGRSVSCVSTIAGSSLLFHNLNPLIAHYDITPVLVASMAVCRVYRRASRWQRPRRLGPQAKRELRLPPFCILDPLAKRSPVRTQPENPQVVDGRLGQLVASFVGWTLQRNRMWTGTQCSRGHSSRDMLLSTRW